MDERVIKEWIENKMPELVEALKQICRIRSVAETENPSCKPYGEGCKMVLRDMLQTGKDSGFSTENFEDYVDACIRCWYNRAQIKQTNMLEV